MKDRRIKELEQQLANKEKENETRNDHPKNLSTVLVSNKDRSEINQTTNEIQVDDILQIISTTMATLKDFENRYKNTKRI